MNIHWRGRTDWRFAMAPVFLAFGAGILLMVGEEFVALLFLAVAMVMQFLEVDVKPKKKKEKLGVQ